MGARRPSSRPDYGAARTPLKGKRRPVRRAKKGLEEFSIEKKNNKKYVSKHSTTYAEIACGCFTALRKRATFAATSSRLVATVEALDFFGRLPK